MDETVGNEIVGMPTIPEMRIPPAGSQIPFQILTEHRTRRQGGKLFHLRIKGFETILTQKEASRLANQILKVLKEK